MIDWHPSAPQKASPGYRPGEKEEIERFMTQSRAQSEAESGDGHAEHGVAPVQQDHRYRVIPPGQLMQSARANHPRAVMADRRARELLARFRRALNDPAAVPTRSGPPAKVMAMLAGELRVGVRRVEDILRRGLRLEAGGEVQK